MRQVVEWLQILPKDKITPRTYLNSASIRTVFKIQRWNFVGGLITELYRLRRS